MIACSLWYGSECCGVQSAPLGACVACSSKDLQVLQTNMTHSKGLHQGELGIRDNIVVPDGASMAAIAETLQRMEQTTSAMVKLELLLEAVKLTYDNVSQFLSCWVCV